jgi:drug/metabolite transporter (DMT)-like permease
LVTIIICAFTGVIENIGFFYLPRYYSPHIYAPYVNVYLVFLPFLGKAMFNAPVRKEHWFGVAFVILGLAIPYIPAIVGSGSDTSLDSTAIIWLIIINCCLCSQQVLNNKTVQTALKGVGPNALVVWREIWKMVFISAAILIIPAIGNMINVNMPTIVDNKTFETRVLDKVSPADKTFLLEYYKTIDSNYILADQVPPKAEEEIKNIISSADYNRFFALFRGSIIPNNWLPILFVIAAGLTGYIYSFGFFKLSRFSAHFWVPYTNVYIALLPLIMILFGKEVTTFQIIGAVVVTAGLMVGVSDYSRNKVEEIKKKY